MPSDRIKVGLFVDSFFVPAWIYETLKRISESEYATISLVVKKQTELSQKHQQGKSYNGFNFLAYNLYRKLENKYIKPNPNAFSQKNIADLVNAIPLINIQSVKEGNNDRIKENDMQLINSYQLD